MEKQMLRAPAVPLIVHDPLFSVWSFADHLNDDATRHWDGVRQSMMGLVSVDGVVYEFMGRIDTGERYCPRYRKLNQVDCQIRPMSTVYRFGNDVIDMTLTFTSPLLLNDLMVLSRPVSYISYSITPKDDKPHDIDIHFAFTGEFCVNETTQEVFVGLTPYSIYLSSGTEHMLQSAGDDHRIEWGSFHVVAPEHTQNAMSLRAWQQQLSKKYANRIFPVNATCSQGPNRECIGPGKYDLYQKTPVHPYFPTIAIAKTYHTQGQAVSDHIAVAYDDVKSIQYFGENIDAYWKKDGDSFGAMLRKSIHEYPEIMEKVAAAEDELLSRARKISDRYADILALSYRQVVGGHKLTWHDGQLQFFSKENYSNGCIATVDVTYPSIPLFLIYAPELVEGMLNPIFKMIDRGLWDYEFAPHDVGTYPLANGQIYGYSFRHRQARPNPIDSQMPVEECGNMLLCVAGVCFAKGDMTCFKTHMALLKQWADYLVKTGYNPDSQLCTDDFAGHLAHNCNLSVKAICALGAYGKMLRTAGQPEDARHYEDAAKEMAQTWEEKAFDGDHYRLCFDQPGTWSLKYNMVWDKLLGLHLFSKKVYDLELAWYQKKCNRYGVPLDSRGDYTKTDWELWSTALFDCKAYTDAIIDSMWDFLNETPDRIPFSDLTFTSQPMTRGFWARTVQGGLFINLLKFESLDK